MSVQMNKFFSDITSRLGSNVYLVFVICGLSMCLFVHRLQQLMVRHLFVSLLSSQGSSHLSVRLWFSFYFACGLKCDCKGHVTDNV